MTEQNRQLIKKVLDYPENTAGGLMNTDLILIRPNHTLEVVMRYLRIKKNWIAFLKNLNQILLYI